jgi:carboxypeptidase D
LPYANSFPSEKAGLCLNVYDVRLKDEIPACGMNWPYDLKNVTLYLRVRSLSPRWLLTYYPSKQRPDVVNALHAQAKSEAWVECLGRIHGQLRQKNAPSSVTVLPRVLEKIPVLLFAGDQDLICNYVGQESLIQSLTWNGGTGLGVRTGFYFS